jgi:cytochrome bd ubiquinol oxidase subunit II
MRYAYALLLTAAVLIGIGNRPATAQTDELSNSVKLQLEVDALSSLSDLNLTPDQLSSLKDLATVALFMMHGAIYLVLRTEGGLREHIRQIANRCMILFVLMYVMVTIATLMYVPRMEMHMKQRPWLLLAPLLTLLAIANVPRQMTHKRQYGHAFVFSCVAIIGLILLVAIGMFPDFVVSSSPAHESLTLYNAASTSGTLKNMLIIALIGMPLVSTYTVAVYWLFRGKVRMGRTSY